MAFKLKSGNKISFKEMGSSPLKVEPGLADPIAPVADVTDVNVDAEAGGEAVDVNVDVQDAGLGRARR